MAKMNSDVVIVGGGMVGACLALALSALTTGKLKIDLIESHRPSDQAHPGFDARTIALSSGSCQELAKINLWQVLSDIATPITEIHVTEQQRFGQTTILASDYNLSSLGYVVELYDIGVRLFERLEQTNVRLHCPASVKAVEREHLYSELTLDNGTILRAKLIIAADGSFSTIAKLCQHRMIVEDYQQVAVIANIETEELHQGRAFERFTAQGPLALLPMRNNRSSLVWCHDNKLMEEIVNWQDAVFIKRLQAAFGWRLGKIMSMSNRSFYPLVLRRADRLISHRLVLVGNAAQTLHPIAGQGFNLGLRDVISLAEIIALAEKQGVDVGSYPLLRRYKDQRNSDRNKTIKMTDSLVRLFSNQITPLVVARNLGLMLVDQQPVWREHLIHRTLGWVER